MDVVASPSPWSSPVKTSADLPQRVLSALVLIPLFLALTYLGDWPFLLTVEGIVLLGLWEWCTILEGRGYAPRRGPALVVGLIIPLALWPPLGREGWPLALVLGLAVVGFSLVEVLQGGRRESLINLALTWWGVSYLSLLLAHFLLLRQLPGMRGLEDRWGWGTLFLVYGVTWIADSVAYFVGRRWGRHRLAPAISPGKSIEGGVAGVLSAPLSAWLLGPTLTPFLSPGHTVVLGLVTGFVGLLGDLAESLFKRSLEVKDTSRLIPGHGGVLDRLDSLLFAVPSAYYYLYFVVL